MPVRLVLWGVLILHQKCTTSAQDDLEAAAITVYRNPEFFRHLSEEFNNYVNDFSSERPFIGPKDKYVSPFAPEANQNYQNTNDEPQLSDEDSESQRSPEDEEENYREENTGGESEGGGFNTFNPSESGNEGINVPDNEEQTEEEGDNDYKYPGEPKKPNIPESPKGGGHFEPSPDFDHPPRRLPPKKPKKKGRGPYGHPKIAAQEEDFRSDYEEEELPRYGEDFEESRKKSEGQLSVDVEKESQRYRDQNQYNENPRNVQELKIFHNGQRYPVNTESYSEPHEPLHEQFPLGHYENYDHYHPYISASEEPNAEHYLPTAQSAQYSKDAEVLTTQKGPSDFRETKKGTREYLKSYKKPPSHELEDLNQVKVRKDPKKPEIVGCNTMIRQKRPRKFVTYHVRPVYAQYKVVPVYYATRRHHPTLYKRSAKGKHRSPLRVRVKTVVDDDSAYVINSELDQDYQNLRAIKREST